MTATRTFRTPLTYLRRDQRYTMPSLEPERPTPSRDLLASTPSAQTALDRYEAIRQTWQDHLAKAAQARAEAEGAAADYTAKVKAAIVNGTDASRIVSKETALRTQAQAHDELAATALNEARVAGYEAAATMSEQAPGNFSRLDADLADAATTLRATLGQLADAWSQWGGLWEARLYLSHCAVVGSCLNHNVPGHGATLPDDVRAALAALTGKLGAVDTLRTDEAEVAAWRENERLGREASAAMHANAQARTAKR